MSLHPLPFTAMVLAAAASLASVSPARAAVAIVYDPTNAIHNAATAAHALESLSNQSRQLVNEAQMLARSPLSQSGEIGEAVRSMTALSRQVTGLTSEVKATEQQFAALFPTDVAGQSRLKLIEQSLQRLTAARSTAQDLARTAAELSGRGDDQQRRITAAMGASEGSSGVTAAVQSSTQLMGVLAEQLSGLQTLMSAQALLAAEEAARSAADRAASLEAHRQRWAHEASPPSAPAFDPFAARR